MSEQAEKRRSPRYPLHRLDTEMEVGGVTVHAHVADLSPEGLRLVIDDSVALAPEDEVRIAIGRISPNVRGRVRWIAPAAGGESRRQVGVKFESFVLEEPDESEIQDLLAAWQDISRSYSVFESFQQILLMLDFDIVDGKLDDLSEAIYSIGVWVDRSLGPLNLWSVLRESDGTPGANLLAERHPVPDASPEARRAQVSRVGQAELTAWLGGRAYLYGGEVVIEYLGEDQGRIDILQRLAVLLSRRIQFWSKLLMNLIALKLLGEELERLRE